MALRDPDVYRRLLKRMIGSTRLALKPGRLRAVKLGAMTLALLFERGRFNLDKYDPARRFNWSRVKGLRRRTRRLLNLVFLKPHRLADKRRAKMKD